MDGWRFAPNEMKEIAISWIALSVIFSIVWGSGNFFMILVTLGLGFIGHELAHKFVAQGYGFLAQYRMNPSNLLFAFFLALMSRAAGFGIVFAAPGAVVIFPQSAHGRRATMGQMGRIGIAGSIANLTFATLFAAMYIFAPFSGLQAIAHTGLWVNAFLALFNMIPFGVLDGAKVYRWDKKAWAGVVIVALFALSLSF